MTLRKKTDFIAIHCSATRPSMDIGVKEITAWHKAKGWRTIGYNYVIRRNGLLEVGRKENEVGAHVEGFNEVSLGVCLVGGVHEDDLTPEANYTPEQMNTLATFVKFQKTKYPDAKIQGHRDFPNVKKACPCFDVGAWVKSLAQ